ncbi:hypothetical protein FOS14_18715 [Skermania sp. ID1734]|uniref:monovalent cation/H+ antiporter complex subunit F n=1 Tax=Skermania sp. ID1734 TaxID=2597516 RepID=UPI001180652D|nr:monovalent cation/H+ antiporter complex subunit F [Skermania sp. ID1734]TSD95388.1 hypothetical protein FOS14_18715 [Skermania sp. ID1734]
MNNWLLGALILLAAGFGTALWLSSRGAPEDRLVGLEISGVVTVLTLMLLSQGLSQPSYLIVPVVMVLMSFAGTLVFTRLLARRS